MPETILQGQETQQTDTQEPAAQPSEWYAKLPDELRNEPSLEPLKAKSFEDAIRWGLENKKAIGATRRIPGQNASQEEWDKFFNHMGRPESPDLYELPQFEPPEGMEVKFDEELLNEAKSIAHKSGLTKKQFGELFNVYMKAQLKAAQNGQGAATPEESMNALKETWKGDIDKNLSIAQKAFKYHLPKDLMAKVDEKYGNDPLFIQAMYEVGKSLAEDGISTTGASPGVHDINSLNAEEERLRANPGYLDEQHPEHKMLNRRVDEIDRQRNEILRKQMRSNMSF